jgi:SAM-dependent methyltransferase
MYEHIYRVEQAHWWYVGRRRIVFEWVIKLLADHPLPGVLDVGCGTGFNIEALHATGYEHVVGLDLSSEALSFCRLRGLESLVCGDGANPPLNPESFEVILALDMIEHLADDVSALRALGRLLKPGGSLVVFVPAFQFLWGLQDEVSHHYRRYTARELGQKLSLAGLDVVKLSYANMFLFPLILVGRLVLRLFGNRIRGTSENDLHPGWSNGLLQAIFASERFLLRHVDLPFGVSVLCVATKVNDPI